MTSKKRNFIQPKSNKTVFNFEQFHCQPLKFFLFFRFFAVENMKATLATLYEVERLRLK
jgi:hypothetical protein